MKEDLSLFIGKLIIAIKENRNLEIELWSSSKWTLTEIREFVESENLWPQFISNGGETSDGVYLIQKNKSFELFYRERGSSSTLWEGRDLKRAVIKYFEFQAQFSGGKFAN